MSADTEQEIANAGAKAEELGPKDRFEAEVKKLAGLNEIEYNFERKNSARKLDVTVAFLDRAVRSERNNTTESSCQGRPISLPNPEPWPDSVNGVELLNDITAAIRRYVVLTTAQADAIAVWVVHCYIYDIFTCTARLAITSPEKQCGKTTLLEVLGCLVPRALSAGNITSSAVFRTVEIVKPILLIDEADTFLSGNDGLRGVLNSGHRQNGQVIRIVGDNHEPRAFSTHSPAAIAMIGKLPPTLADRSITIALRRRLATETADPFREHKAHDLKQLSQKIARWTIDKVASLRQIDPKLPAFLINRSADNWGPLFAIAEAAGGGWPNRVRRAAEAIESNQGADEQSVGEQLLADLKEIFDETQLQRMPSQEVVNRLVSKEGRPWADWSHGSAMTPNQLARALKAFGIAPQNVRLSDRHVLKGYYRKHLDDPIKRYLTKNDSSPTPANDESKLTVDSRIRRIEASHRYNPESVKLSDEIQPATKPFCSGLERYESPNEIECSGSNGDVVEERLGPLRENDNDQSRVADVTANTTEDGPRANILVSGAEASLPNPSLQTNFADAEADIINQSSSFNTSDDAPWSEEII